MAIENTIRLQQKLSQNAQHVHLKYRFVFMYIIQYRDKYEKIIYNPQKYICIYILYVFHKK